MTAIYGKWVGAIQGTNNGAVFAEFVEINGRLAGMVHINDPAHGVGVYDVTTGQVSPDEIRFVLTPN